MLDRARRAAGRSKAAVYLTSLFMRVGIWSTQQAFYTTEGSPACVSWKNTGLHQNAQEAKLRHFPQVLQQSLLAACEQKIERLCIATCVGGARESIRLSYSWAAGHTSQGWH